MGYSQNLINELNSPFVTNQLQIENNNQILNNLVAGQIIKGQPVTTANSPNLVKQNVGYINLNFFIKLF